MGQRVNPLDDDMPAEIDFSKSVRGKFFQRDAKLNLPIYMDGQVQATLTALDLSALGQRPPKVIELIELGR